MLFYIMTETEQQFAEIIWDSEPLGSGQLVKLAFQKLNWKKSTTYTVLRKLCENGIFKNEDAVVSAVISGKNMFVGKVRFIWKNTIMVLCLNLWLHL